MLLLLAARWAVNLLIALFAGGGIVMRMIADRLVGVQKFLTNEIQRRRAA